MPVEDPVFCGDQVRHDRIQDLVSTVSVVVGLIALAFPVATGAFRKVQKDPELDTGSEILSIL